MSTTIKSFFDRQKCDLSNKSNEDVERKKVRERAVKKRMYHLVKMTRIFLKKK